MTRLEAIRRLVLASEPAARRMGTDAGRIQSYLDDENALFALYVRANRLTAAAVERLVQNLVTRTGPSKTASENDVQTILMWNI